MTALERYRATLAGQPVDRLPAHPVTMMFASRLIGRTFYDYIMDHRVMAAGQLAMVEQFDVDCVQTISDPCREVDDLGGECTYFTDEAPANDARLALLRDKARLVDLRPADPLGGGRMHDRVQAVALLRQQCGPDFSVQGWVEGPIALAVDLRGMQDLMTDTVDDPDFVRDLFAFSVDQEIAFARAQVAAGADTIGVGDAAASLLGGSTYRELVWPEERRLVDAIHELGALVRLHICGRTTHLVEEINKLGCDYVDIDFLCDLTKARAALPETAILGNLDPTSVLLRGTPEQVYDGLAACHAICGRRFVVGAGCEVPNATPHLNLQALVAYAKDHGA
ncbi:MAG: uroporphyrinogen decarboxylase family protein [Fimbriimonadaceae bacterium]|nr:uroporphyrinogen decarboxylase family protein [Fimbriimonadaceae bacterium]